MQLVWWPAVVLSSVDTPLFKYGHHTLLEYCMMGLTH